MILITGASKGIGKYLLENYIKEQEKVYGTYNSTLPKEFANCKNYTRVDVTSNIEIDEWLKSIDFDEEITLIICAGISYNSFAHKSDPEKWKKVIEINVLGAYNVIRQLLPHMRDANFGRIINFSSVVAQKGTPGVSAYSASKSALWGMAKAIAVENASKGITINNINLGYSELGMIEEVPEIYKEAIINQIPNGELCKKEDIFKCVEFLRDNSYTNGSSVDLNGGLF
jgi:NAD(P)-dependent dehydrogenase (short-subunit alcohol dehydrogenase family)